MNTIDYSLLAVAVKAYSALGYVQIEVPWRVSMGIIDITLPPNVTPYVIADTNKGLIGSGEQGFMTLMNKGILPPGKYQTVTPCFRNEPYDFTHSKQFMKLELIEVLPNSFTEYQRVTSNMLLECSKVFMALAELDASHFHIAQQNAQDPLLVSTTSDIEIKVQDRMIEIGSYGVRRAHFGAWAYGTGLAEPRFSKSVHAIKNLNSV